MSMKLKYGVLVGLAVVFIAGAAVAQIEDGADVWYRVAPSAAGTELFTLSLDGFDDATLALFEGNTIATSPATAVPARHREYSKPWLLTLDGAKEYFVRVAGLKQTGGEFAQGEFKLLLQGDVDPDVVDELIADDLLENFDDIADDDGKIGFEEAQSIIPGLTQTQFNALDRNGDGKLEKCELEIAAGTFQVAVTLTAAPAVPLDCEVFDDVWAELGKAFKSVSAVENCGDVDRTADVVVASIKRDNVALTADELAEIAGKIEGFGNYDGSILKTREMFFKYLIFQPGVYALTYEVEGVTAVQTITIDKACGGCMGCYSCDSCAGCRPEVPSDWATVKRLMSDWLLVGLSMMVLMSLSSLRKN